MKRLTIQLLILVLISGILLSACNLNTGSPTQVSQDQLNTQVAIQLTQIAYQTLAANATQWAAATSTPTMTATPTVTATPTITPTATATATAAIPTATATATAVPIPCNQATYIMDVSIPDNTSLTVGQSFVKTWRIQNSGSCTWTNGYAIYFVNGTSMGAPASVLFPKSVKPGESMDISVPMVAPGTAGTYAASWMLMAPNGSVFGVGKAGGVPLTVVIQTKSIPAPNDTHTIYDFAGNYCAAQWRTNAGFITCPSANYDFKNGSILRSYTPLLESGSLDDEGALITIPSIGGDGFIQGQFPKVLIHAGDHFKASLLCSYNMPKCSVNFELLYMVSGTSSVTSLGNWDKVYDGSILPVDVDLSTLDGKEVIFFLKVSSKADSTDDFAQWMAARITHP